MFRTKDGWRRQTTENVECLEGGLYLYQTTPVTKILLIRNIPLYGIKKPFAYQYLAIPNKINSFLSLLFLCQLNVDFQWIGSSKSSPNAHDVEGW